MSAQKYFLTPFGALGDKTAIPDAAPGDGSVSYASGFGVDYEGELGVDPDAKPIPRDEFNQLAFDITDNLRQYQLFGFPEWVEASQNGGTPVSYSANAFVRWAGVLYYSLVNANTVEPGTDPTKWATFTPSVGAALLAANNLSDLTNAATARSNLGLGSMATQATTNWLPKNAPAFTGGLSGTGGIDYTGSTKANVLAAPAGATRDLDVGASDFHTLNLTASANVTFSNATAARALVILVELTISSNAVPTWPAGVTWNGGTVPTFTNGTHLLGFVSFNGGATWRGVVGGRNFA